MMTNVVAMAVFVATLTVGCGGSGDCDMPDGLYRVSLRQESGNCGPISDSVISIPSMTMNTCVSTGRIAADMCWVEVNFRCPQADGSTLTLIGKLDVVGRSGHASGTIYLTDDDRRGPCSSVYAATYTKL